MALALEVGLRVRLGDCVSDEDCVPLSEDVELCVRLGVSVEDVDGVPLGVVVSEAEPEAEPLDEDEACASAPVNNPQTSKSAVSGGSTHLGIFGRPAREQARLRGVLPFR